MANAKIRIKVGDVEVDYEGDATFLDKNLTQLIKDLQTVQPKTLAAATGKIQQTGQPAGLSQQLTTKSIATKLNLKSGSELALAAVAHLGIIKSMATFKRGEINDAMKSATGIYTPNMGKNLSASLGKLLSDEAIVETATGVYALTPAEEGKLKGQLGLG